MIPQHESIIKDLKQNPKDTSKINAQRAFILSELIIYRFSSFYPNQLSRDTAEILTELISSVAKSWEKGI